MTRLKINLKTSKEVTLFIREMNNDGHIDDYVLEDAEGECRVSARSYLGVLYASIEFEDGIYLVNKTEDGIFPSFIVKFI